ncbi:hypothetical protein [Nocardia asiatica]|uniref:hypothetical protein n=1 Tax=Nocardia asiatica TaxID=209252 RepID=UPI00245570FF|nr:hypothetical protein [Nocardia asiatica]
MSPDRCGDQPSGAEHDRRCRRGFLGEDDEGRPIPCLVCKPHLRQTSTTHDFAESTPSLRAQQAIEGDNQ